MHILLTNDDGILAPGIAAIHEQLIKIAKVTVAAPAQAKSGASHSISFEPLICDKIEITGKFTGYSIDGSPADCVKLAVREIIGSDEKIDLVVSGMNHGANVGINVCYSGTVAAAMEAAFFGIPSIAISAAFEENLNFKEAAKHGIEVIKKLLPLTPQGVININIPRLSEGKPKGVKVMPQSVSGFEEYYDTTKNEQGRTVYQLNGGDHRDEKASATDTTALIQGFITVTALHFDMTDHERTDDLKKIQW